MEDFIANDPDKSLVQVLGHENFKHYCQPLIDLAILWEFAQTLGNYKSEEFLPTYGEFMNFCHHRSRLLEDLFPMMDDPPTTILKCLPTSPHYTQRST